MLYLSQFEFPDADREFTEDSRIITSDDVFDFMLNLRSLNEGIDSRREDLYAEYRRLTDTSDQRVRFQLHSLEDYEQLKRVTAARRKTQSKFVRDSLGSNIRERSNVRTYYEFFKKHESAFEGTEG